MLSSVLNSERAVQANIAIMRTFVKLRQMLASNAELARKLNALEKKYDAQFKMVFDAIRELMTLRKNQSGRSGMRGRMIEAISCGFLHEKKEENDVRIVEIRRGWRA